MRKAYTLFASLLLCTITHASTKVVISNTNTGWGTAANWLPTGVPKDGDVVVIPPGMSISVKGSFYTTAANITIYIHGNLDFHPSGKLNLGSNSVVQLTTSTSSITSNGTSSEQIVIGGGIKYNGSNDGTVTGPAFTTNSSPNSSKSNAKTSFTFGVLPVKLISFAAQEANNTIRLNWVTAMEEGLKAFELQRSTNGKDWQTIATVQPKNTCGCATSYQYEDKFAKSGINYYRLHSLDWDGRSGLSAVIMFKFDALQSKDVVWRLNSAGSLLRVSLSPTGFEFPVQMQLIASNGQVLQNRSLVSAFNSLDIKPLASGMSILVLQDKKGKKSIVKLVK